MTTEELILTNAYNNALLDVLTYVVDMRDYKTRRAILNLWKDGEREQDKTIIKNQTKQFTT